MAGDILEYWKSYQFMWLLHAFGIMQMTCEDSLAPLSYYLLFPMCFKTL